MRQQFWTGVRLVGEMRRQRVGDPTMQRLALSAQHGAIGRVLDEGVLEDIGGLRGASPREYQVSLDQLEQRRVEGLGRPVRDDRQQGVWELPPDRGSDLGDLLARGQAIQPGQQRRLERGGDRDRRQRSFGVQAAGLGRSRRMALQHRPCDLLDEQRHALGVIEDLVQDRRR